MSFGVNASVQPHARGAIRIGRSICVLFVSCFVLPGSLRGQSDFESGVRRRLAEALQLSPRELTQIARDYSSGLFPSMVFYRAQTPGGFHTRARAAALVVTQGDTIVVRDLNDLAAVWRRAFPSKLPETAITSIAVRELLFQTGMLQRGDNVIRSQADLSKSYRAFLAPDGDLSLIQAPEESVDGRGVSIRFFVQTAEGVVRYSAVASRDGRLEVAKEVVVRSQMS